MCEGFTHRLTHYKGMLALDPVLTELRTVLEASPRRTFTTKDIHKFNPYETIQDEQRTYYECMSILNTFVPMSCPSSISQDKWCVMDMDLTGGCRKAIQHRYPNAIVFSSSLSGNGMMRTPRTVKEYLLSRNRYGADFSFCIDSKEFDIARQVMHATDALTISGMLALRLSDPYTTKVGKAIEHMLWRFKEVWMYKCATMSCVRDECYVIGVGKVYGISTTPTVVMGQEVVEKFVDAARSSVASGVDNTNIASPESLRSMYKGI